MKRSILLLGSALLFTATVHAQQAPWVNLPVAKKITTFDGEEKTLRLKLDTLVAEAKPEPGDPFYYEMATWYSQPSNKMGYGYMTEEGKPVGVWRYYIKNEDAYELFAEGYLENLTADRMAIDPKYTEGFTAADTREWKVSFVSSVKKKSFFTGEWRFYKKGKLATIVTLDTTVKLPLSEAANFNEKGALSSTQIAFPHPEQIHLAGTVLSTIYFSPDGRVTEVVAEGVNLKFDKNGKPVIEPLYESPYLD